MSNLYKKIKYLDIQILVSEKIQNMYDFIHFLEKYENIKIQNNTYIQQTKQYNTIGLFLDDIKKNKDNPDNGIFDNYFQILVNILYNNKPTDKNPSTLTKLFDEINNNGEKNQ